jgi:hypothetical protein
VLPLLFVVTLIGCASTVATSERAAGLARFLALPAPAIMSQPRPLTVDPSLLVIREEEVVAPLVGAFDSAGEVTALLWRIQGSARSLGHGVPEVVHPGTADTAGRAGETPALFVWPTWQVSYQRLPPRFDLIRLELGVIAKVIPSGQVMEGRGSIALRTAAWETRCHRYAANGRYLSIHEWLANDSLRWRNAMAELREACGDQIGAAFEQSVAMLGRVPPTVR